jgi:homoserine O-acetyltransferase/O-succinyltransferase
MSDVQSVETREGGAGGPVTSRKAKTNRTDPTDRVHELSKPLRLESGKILPGVRVAYRTWGRLAPDGGNAVLVCHALTGSADADAWWAGLFGPGRALDPERDFIVCSNILGSCYGTTGPASPRPGEDRTWGPDFPAVTIRDLVRVQHALVRALGIRRLKLVLGGSLGGMQVLEWALLYPDLVEAIAPIAVSGRHSAWCIGLSEAQRQALYADPHWRNGRYPPETPPAAGLAAARAIATCTYRSRGSFEERFGRQLESPGLFQVESYLRHQGSKLVGRFDANSYVVLTRAMDSHDVARGRGSYEKALRAVRQPALVVAIDSDVLYPPEEQRELAARLGNARLAWLRSPHGHDAFLIETEALNRLLVDFRNGLDEPRPTGPRLLPARTDDRNVRVVVAGATGRVGSRLCDQLGRRDGARLRLVGALNRRHLVWDDAGLDPLAVPAALDAGGPSDWESLAAHLGAPGDPLIFVDCTASPAIAERYPSLLAAGIGVVTPSKLAGSGLFERWRLLRELSVTRSAPWRYETTVGAALPVLGPLADLRRAGDRLVSLTAILSGTLSFVLHRVSEGTLFSAAVAEAHLRGLTEPHPQEDLTGEDVARKLLILLREAGFAVERREVIVEPLIPGDIPDEPDPERFLAGLIRYDAAWTARAAEARARGERLFHVAQFDANGPRVGVASLSADHPVARAGAGENVVVVHTDRYSDLPLTISGPGAGPEITASGVLIDLLAAAAELAVA